jgi:ADP-heptose:LPS heptosyltransferase
MGELIEFVVRRRLDLAKPWGDSRRLLTNGFSQQTLERMKILVIRLKEIGDALLSLPLCRSLRKSIPDAEIHYLVYEHIAPLFMHDPAIDQVQVYTPAERAKPHKYLQKMFEIRKHDYDIVIDILTVPVTVLMTRLTGARWQIGFDKGRLRSRWYKTRIPHPASLGPLDSKLKLLDGVPFPTEIERDFSLNLMPDEVAAMRSRMEQHGIDFSRRVLMFSPISRIGKKSWPKDYFVKLIDFCLANYDTSAVLIWGPGERELVNDIASRVVYKSKLHADIETRTTRELALLARNCSIFIGNDSGPRHVSEAAGISTFTIFSPQVSKHHWLPNPGPDHRAVDMCDVLDIDIDTWHEMAPLFRKNRDEYYERITPDIVISRLAPMLDEILDIRKSV